MRKKLSFLQTAEPIFLSKTSSTINIILPNILQGSSLQGTKRPLCFAEGVLFLVFLFGQGAIGGLQQDQQLFLSAGLGVDIG